MKELAELIKEIAYLEGEFTLRSGQKSTYYIDKYLFGTNYRVLDLLAKQFAKKLLTYPDFDALGAPELGAVSIVAHLSVAAKKNFLIIRKQTKDYGTSKLIEGTLDGVKSAIVVEDILTTGGAAIKAAEVLRDAGVNVLAILGTIDRLQGAKENIEKAGFKHDTLLTIKDLGVKVN
jgi:orotate phosphoribosyltransferase